MKTFEIAIYTTNPDGSRNLECATYQTDEHELREMSESMRFGSASETPAAALADFFEDALED